MARHNGHENWTAWNVSLWVNNDEALYNLARRAIRKTRNRDEAAELMLENMHEAGLIHTPDGVKYSKNTIRKAMRGL